MGLQEEVSKMATAGVSAWSVSCTKSVLPWRNGGAGLLHHWQSVIGCGPLWAWCRPGEGAPFG